MDDLRREIKDALLGRTFTGSDGRLYVMGDGDFRLPLGVGEGAASIRVLGVSKSTWRFVSSYDVQKTIEIASQCMLGIGRRLILRTRPYAAACFVRSVLVRPVVMVFEYDEAGPVLSIFTGRSATSIIAVRRAYKSFADQLPSSIVPAGKLSEDNTKKDKEEGERK